MVQILFCFLFFKKLFFIFGLAFELYFLCTCYLLFCRDLAASLNIVATVVDRPFSKKELPSHRFKEVSEMSAPISRLIKGVYPIVARGSTLSTAAFYLIFPVIRGIFDLYSLLPGCEAALLVLDLTWLTDEKNAFSEGEESLGPEHLRPLLKQVVETILKALATFRVEPPPENVLLRITGNCVLTHTEWVPILGNLGLLCEDPKVRVGCLRVIQNMIAHSSKPSSNTLLENRLWLSRFDDAEEVKQLAIDLWETKTLKLLPTYSAPLIELMSHEFAFARSSAAKAIAGALLQHPHTVEDVLSTIFHMYTSSVPPKALDVDATVQIKDMSGKPKKNEKPKVETVISKLDALRITPQAEIIDEKAATRSAVAQTLLALGSQQSLKTGNHNLESLVIRILQFIIDHGVVDPRDEVRSIMINAGRSIVDNYGEVCDSMIHLFEDILARQLDATAKSSEVKLFDSRKEAGVVFLGGAGKHLSKDNPSVLLIVDSMLDALKTPSASVQQAVSDALVGLVQLIKGSETANQQLESLLNLVVNGESYGDRMGAAMGLSAYVKGLGIPCLKQHGIVEKLKDICSEGSIINRQGSLFAFECLSDRLGLLFEPYIITIMPILLKSFSHSSDHVRDAAQNTAKVVMKKLSAHGVKQVLTPILMSLPTETQWKSRQEAIRLLGTMAHCAPRQLAACLPQIVPRLVEAVSDPHPKVKDSAKTAMIDIASVIKNPEISALGPTLLAALGDPANKTKDALEALLQTEFMHSIDAPSLGILVPILARALRDRGADIKRKSSAITGNICSMINDSKILVPYIPQVLPGLKDCLLDPIPDVRATSAKALGSLAGGVGEAELGEDILKWLFSTVTSDSSSVERSGAAQGLAEISLALGRERRAQILSVVLPYQHDKKASAREGLLWILSYFPSVLGEQFAEYIETTLPVVLRGLCDSSEGVRDTALRAGQVMVVTLGRNHALKLLPALAGGLFDDDWRIRQSSVSLLGELLYMVGDTKSVSISEAVDDDDDDDGFTVNGSSKVLGNIRSNLGDVHTDMVLAALYIARSDISMSVRQGTLQVWKSIVSNGPRTLREIMPELLNQLMEKLSSESEDLRGVAGRALGDVVKKMGDKVLPSVIPHLESGLESEDAGLRQGVCLGLTEILSSASKSQIEQYIDTLNPALQRALCDTSDVVRHQAAVAFQTMMKTIGPRAIDDVVPTLLKNISENTEADNELPLAGLREIVQLRPRDLLEYLLPRLLVSPMSVIASKTLSIVAEVTGAQLNYHFDTLVPQLVRELITSAAEAERATAGSILPTNRFTSVKIAATKVMGSVVTTGVNYLLDELGHQIEHEIDPERRRWGCVLLADFIKASKADYDDYVSIILKYLLGRVADTNRDVLVALSDALTVLCNTVPHEKLIENMNFILSAISSTASDARHRTDSLASTLVSEIGDSILPLFTVPKSLDSLLSVFLFALMNGSVSQREIAADGIGEFVKMSEISVLKPFFIKATGPLIRVVGDRFPSSVKAAILNTLSILLDRGGVLLKAFVPQLQASFVKSLNDPLKAVRNSASINLGKLMKLTVRIDPLLSELCTGCASAESNSIQASFLDALGKCLQSSGQHVSPALLEKLQTLVAEYLVDDDESIRSNAATLAQGLGAFCDATNIQELLGEIVGTANVMSLSWTNFAGRLIGAANVVQAAGEKAAAKRGDAFALIHAGLIDARTAVRIVAANAVAQLYTIPQFVGSEGKNDEFLGCMGIAIDEFASAISEVASDAESGDVRRAAISAIKLAAKNNPDVAFAHIQTYMPCLISEVKGINIRVKSIAERAMRYLLKGASLPAINAYASKTNREAAQFVREYSHKLLKLPDDSDNESPSDFW